MFTEHIFENPFYPKEKTFDEFIEGLDFSKGYVTFMKSYSYVGKGGFRFQYDYHDFSNHRSELVKRGYHLYVVNESDNFFRDDLVTYVYRPEDLSALKMKKFKDNLGWYVLGMIPILMIICIAIVI